MREDGAATDDHVSHAGGSSAGEEAIGRYRAALLGGGEEYTAEQVASVAGVPRELSHQLWRAMGFADIPDEEVAFTHEDVEALRRAAGLIASNSLAEADLLHLARVLGQATARMADSVVSFSAERIAEGRRVDVDILEQLDQLVVYLLNRNLVAAIRRTFSEATLDGGATLAVGFADLVGYTRLSQRLDDGELSALIEEFEARTSEIVAVSGGRVVKMIGDEVMWSSEPATAVEIALQMAESFTDGDTPGVRVGLASGSVVTRAGDLFGPTVNLAARATTMARPGSVLVSEDLFGVVENDPRYRLRRLRPRRLKGIGWANLAAVLRNRDHPPPPGSLGGVGGRST